MSLSSGHQLGRYLIESALGAGGMGEVYLARDTQLDRRVAIKVLPEHLTTDSEARERFEREAKAIATLSHPNILTIHDFGSESDTEYAVTELLEGETVEGLLRREETLPWRRVLEMALAVADGLSAAHAKGILHRDIKPANLFVRNDGRIVILDFGLAKVKAMDTKKEPSPPVSPDLPTRLGATTMPGSIMGTLRYMSPEQAKGLAVSPASDVFSLGCVLYEMLTGAGPFTGDTFAEVLATTIRDDPAPLMRRDCPKDLEHIVLKALRKDPAQRYPSGEEFREALASLQELVSGNRPGTPLLGLAKRFFVTLTDFLAGRSSRAESKKEWAREKTIPELMALIGDEKFHAAFELALEAEKFIPNDPVLNGLWDRMSSPITIETEPPGADIFFKPYNDVDGDWRRVGTTPVREKRLASGPVRWRIVKEGFETRELASSITYAESTAEYERTHSFSTPSERCHMHFILDREGSLPTGMIAVDGGKSVMSLSRLPVDSVDIERYFIDRTPVTNKEFKDFVDVGGYANRDYWRIPFEQDGRELSWEEGMAHLVDMTGRPGPATWEMSHYPDGQDDYPVRGVSWYEAAAYAEFRGKILPTIYHWGRAALPSDEHVDPLLPSIVPLSNFGGEGPAPVGSFPAISHAGAYDMAGNVREWCWNSSGSGRYSLGGAWSDPTYNFTDSCIQAPFERFETNGFRCMQYAPGAAPVNALRDAIVNPFIDYCAVETVSDDAFKVYKQLAAYKKTPLKATIDSRDDSVGEWVRETVSIDAAYDGERIIIHLDLPTNAVPPFQPCIYFPGKNALEQSYFKEAYWENFDFIPRSGRVFVRPVIANTYERGGGHGLPYDAKLINQWRKDLGRTIDYLAERPDIDTEKIAYMGLSLGAVVVPFLCAMEKRIQSIIMIAGGATDGPMFSYVGRIATPLLMLNGRYDYIFPLELTQTPFFERLATPDGDKRHVIFDAGHLPLPRGEMIKEILTWLERYQNPVNLAGQSVT